MIIYIVLLLITTVIFKISKNKKRALTFIFIVLTFVAAFRKYTVGIDTLQFYSMYEYIGEELGWNYSVVRYEPGFYYLCKLLYILFPTGQALIIVSSIFINLSVYTFIKNHSCDYYVSTMLYMMINLYFSYMNTMRQAIAVAVLLLGYNYLKQEKYIKYICFIAIACMFHISAVAMFLPLIFAIAPKKKFVYTLEIITAIVCFLFPTQIFNVLTSQFGYAGYAMTEFGESNYFGSLLVALENMLCICLVSWLALSHKKNIFLKDRILKILMICLVWFNFMTMQMNIFNRISGVFSIYCVIYFPMMLKEIRNRNNYIITKHIILAIYLTSFIIISAYRPEWLGVIPYEFYWNE